MTKTEVTAVVPTLGAEELELLVLDFDEEELELELVEDKLLLPLDATFSELHPL